MLVKNEKHNISNVQSYFMFFFSTFLYSQTEYNETLGINTYFKQPN